jgi:hypothetical protein
VTAEDEAPESFEARVVRLELNDRDRMGLWPFFVAVRFTSAARS